MAAEVEQMHNRLEAFSLGMDRTAIGCAIKAAEELTEQRDVLLAALRDIANYPSATHADCAVKVLDENVRIARAAIARATGSAS